MSLNEFDDRGDFGSLLDKNFKSTEKLEIGQIIEAEIVSISGGYIFIQLDGKSEGIIDSEELKDKDGELIVNEGEKIKAYFISSSNGEKIFTTKLNGKSIAKDLLKNAFESSIPVEGVVSKVIKGGYEVNIGDSRAFCPFSQISSQRVENPEDFVGKSKTFKITEYQEDGRNIIISSRIIEDEIKQEKIETLKGDLKENQIIKGQVISFEKFGAFVDVKGIRALLPISEISRSRVDDIGNFLKIGQDIDAKIISIDWDREKITLSLKELLDDPWESAKTKYIDGERYNGVVSRITNFGVFVELESGIDGLIHTSDYKSDARDRVFGDNLKVGQKLAVQITSMDVSSRRISLKEVVIAEGIDSNSKYFDTNEETYNPFAALLKGKK